MAFQNFPYSNLHELNIDAWLRKQKELDDAQEALEKRQGELEQEIAEVDQKIEQQVPPAVDNWLESNFDRLMVDASYRESDQALVLAPTSEPPAPSQGNKVKRVQLYDQLLALGSVTMYDTFEDVKTACQTGEVTDGDIVCVSRFSDSSTKNSAIYYMTTGEKPDNFGFSVDFSSGGSTWKACLISPSGDICADSLGVFPGTLTSEQISMLKKILSQTDVGIILTAGEYDFSLSETMEIMCPRLIADNVVFNVSFTGGSDKPIFSVGLDYMKNRREVAHGISIQQGNRNIVSGERAGSVIVVSSPEPWNGARQYYTKGEMFRMSGVGSLATCGAVDSYSGAFAYRLPSMSINIRGLTVYTNSDCERVFDVNCLVDSIIENVNIYSDGDPGTGSRIAFMVRFCYQTIIKNCSAYQNGSTKGDTYGISICTSQCCEVDGNFYGYSSGLSVGSYLSAGNNIVNRFLKIRGVFDCETGGAVSCHGNAEYVEFYGTSMNGVMIGGDRIKYHGKVFARTYWCFRFDELIGFDIDISDVECEQTWTGYMLFVNTPTGTRGGVFNASNSRWNYRGGDSGYPGLIVPRTGSEYTAWDMSNSLFTNFNTTYVVQWGSGSYTWRRFNAFGCVYSGSPTTFGPSPTPNGYIPPEG